MPNPVVNVGGAPAQPGQWIPVRQDQAAVAGEQLRQEAIAVAELQQAERIRRAERNPPRGLFAAAPVLPERIKPQKIMKQESPIDYNTMKIGDLFPIPQVQALIPEFTDKFLALHPQLIAKHPYIWKDPKVLVGVEVEVENVLFIDPNISLGFWIITEDGSLRNRGREFKTHPMPLLYLEPALTQLFAGLNQDVDFSSRTSIHFHFDVRHMTIGQTVGLTLTYAAIENLLFKFVTGNRRKNIFCVPITETTLLNKQRGNIVSFICNIKDYWHKYTALNLLPMSELGTVEFRQMPGTKDLQKLLIWADLLSRLRIFAYKHSLNDIIQKISALNTTSEYRKFVESVFGELVTYLDMTTLAQDMDKPVYAIKNSTIINEYQYWLLQQKPVENSFFQSVMFKTNVYNTLSTIEKSMVSFLHKRYGAGDTVTSFYEMLRNNPGTQGAVSAQGPKEQSFIEALFPRASKSDVIVEEEVDVEDDMPD